VKVNLLSHIPDAEVFCAKIARYANVEEDWDNIHRKIPKDGWENFLKRVILMGHTSVLEHAVFTFEVTGISRVTTHQLVRHRIASYLQKSFRKNRPKKVILPDDIGERKYWEKEAMKLFQHVYRTVELPIEDARYFAPMGSETAIIVTMNARELYEVFFPLRLAKNAQWEIRKLANEMLKIVKPIMPNVFEKFQEEV
jgi:thymidylate synthase (FAD)